MAIYDADVAALDGSPAELRDYQGKALLIVNVASQCGLTPQYADKGFAVLGFPCNQFGAQEPGSPDEIASFCETSFGVTFPLFSKLEVNGDGRHALYEELTAHADDEGEAGDIQWNFEKFLVSRDGEVVRRFRPLTTPDDAALVSAIEDQLEGK
jgi:glutathione peroxidase